MQPAAARIVFALAYPLLAHWASHDGGGTAAAVALGDLVLLVLIDPLLRRRGWAWLALAVALGALVELGGTQYAQLLLLAPPMLFLGLVAWLFGRSLRPPRIPVITRIASAIEGHEPAQLPAALYRYTRNLTASWAGLLAVLMVVNAVLALVAVPNGVLARLGHPPAWGVSRERWSLLANLCDYGVVGAFFVGEYVVRQRLFPYRPYANFIGFLRGMGRLGPEFWRNVFR